MNERRVKLIELGSDHKVRIGRQLRAIYSDIVNEGVPDRFSEILHRLDEAGEIQRKNEGTNAVPE
jgi:hypothetical protein